MTRKLSFRKKTNPPKKFRAQMVTRKLSKKPLRNVHQGAQD